MPGHQRRPAARSSWVSQADRAQWQQQASAELAAILAAHPDLPAITWTITPGGGLTGQALVPGDTRGSRELFTAWRRALGVQGVQETTMGDGTSYVRVHASRGTIRVTLTAVVSSLDVTDSPDRRSPRPRSGGRRLRACHRRRACTTLGAPGTAAGPGGAVPGLIRRVRAIRLAAGRCIHIS
jgi:hypothetical protein